MKILVENYIVALIIYSSKNPAAKIKTMTIPISITVGLIADFTSLLLINMKVKRKLRDNAIEYATSSINPNGDTETTITMSFPNTVSDFKFDQRPTIVVADKNSDTTGSADTLTVTVESSATSDSISLLLKETGSSSGIFKHNEFIVMEGAYEFPSDGAVDISQLDGDDDGPGGSLPARGSIDDDAIETITASIKSDTDTSGITLTLTETGKDTNLFTGSLTLDTVSSPDSSIQVIEGDIVSVTIFGQTANGIVTPNPNPNVGALQVGGIGDTITASYLGTVGTATITADTGGGGGGGGINRPGLVFNALGGLSVVDSLLGGGSSAPGQVLTLDKLQFSTIPLPDEVETIVENFDPLTPLEPMSPEDFESFDFPLIIEDKGYPLVGYSNTLSTVTVETNKPTEIVLNFYQALELSHLTMYMDIRDGQTLYDSDLFIRYDKGEPLLINDKNRILEDASFDIEIDDNLKTVTFNVIFAEEMEKSDIILRMWDTKRVSTDTLIYDTINVIASEPVMAVESSISSIQDETS